MDENTNNCESDSSDNFSDMFNDSDNYVLPTSSDSESSSEDNQLIRTQRKRKHFSVNYSKRKLDFTNEDGPSKAPSNCDNSEIITYTRNQQREYSISPAQRDKELDTPKKRARKVIRNTSFWQATIRKTNYQAGKAYVSRRGKQVSKKEILTKKDCLNNCKLKCSSKISGEERLSLFNSYYSLTANEKRHFLVNNTVRSLTARPKRLDAEGNDSRRKYSFKYFFCLRNEEIQVCNNLFIGTLAISQKPIYTAHQTKNPETNTPKSDNRGKSITSRRKPLGNTDFVREHIESFPKVESHYCRSSTKREYLGSDLSISKLFFLYNEKCKERNIVAVKQSMFYKIFVTEYNLGFHIPKGDRCNVCERYKIATKSVTVTEDLEKDYKEHIERKTAMRKEKQKDKLKDSETPILLFDLENVITCPHANISNFFYYHKLRIYNLTAYFSVTKTVYCAIWPEIMAGRKGNDLASAFRKIIEVVLEENDVNNLITWSDSCVPQNRNSIISNAVMYIMRNNPSLNSLTMKYSVPGHSCVQEVDNAHSQIEKAMNSTDFFSPIGFIRLLKNVNRKHPFRIIQMKPENFKDYSSTAKKFNYGLIPYTDVASISFSQTLHEVKYKTSHKSDETEHTVNVKYFDKLSIRKRKEKQQGQNNFEEPPVERNNTKLPENKIKDLKKIYPFMPEQDKEYFNHVLKI